MIVGKIVDPIPWGVKGPFADVRTYSSLFIVCLPLKTSREACPRAGVLE